MNWLKKTTIKIAWPFVKKAIIKQIKNEDFKTIVVNKAEAIIPDGKFTKKAQIEYLNALYQATQEAALDIIENIDINDIVK